MQSYGADQEVLQTAYEWLQQGQEVVLVTVLSKRDGMIKNQSTLNDCFRPKADISEHAIEQHSQAVFPDTGKTD